MFQDLYTKFEFSFWTVQYSVLFVFIYLVNVSAYAQDTLGTADILSDTLAAVTVEATNHQLTVDEAVGSISYISADDLISERGSSTSFSDIVAEVPGLIAQGS